MPDPHLLAAFLAAVLVIMLIPGPNVALIVSNSLTHGSRYGLLTVAGTSSRRWWCSLASRRSAWPGLLGGPGLWFDRLRWVGVAYLLYLGIRQWRAPPMDLAAVKPGPKSLRRLYARAFLVSFTNPKTLFFYGAFFPVRPPGRGSTADSSCCARASWPSRSASTACGRCSPGGRARCWRGGEGCGTASAAGHSSAPGWPSPPPARADRVPPAPPAQRDCPAIAGARWCPARGGSCHDRCGHPPMPPPTPPGGRIPKPGGPRPPRASPGTGAGTACSTPRRALRPVVRRRAAEHLLQLPRPPRARPGAASSRR